MLLRVAVFLLALTPLTIVHAVDYLVTTEADSGTGSLRWAIEQANATLDLGGVPHRIDFHASVGAVILTTPLPPIRHPVLINTDSTRRIGLTAMVPLTAPALEFSPAAQQPETFNPSGSVIDQIDIGCLLAEPCFVNGIRLNRYVDNVLIDRVVVDRTAGVGIHVGGTGILIDRSEVTRAGENAALGHSERSGIHCRWDSSGAAIERCRSLTVVRSHIGVRANGTPRGNATAGIALYNSLGHRIGGLRNVDGNVIAANGLSGIEIGGGNGITIQGNYIGIRADGVLAGNGNPGNAHAAGIVVTGGRSLLIGGDLAALGNIVTGNGYSNIRLEAINSPLAGQPPTRVWRNRIGTTAAGLPPGPVTTRYGIDMNSNLRALSIGGDGHGNTIAHHLVAGIQSIRASSTVIAAHAILGNAIYGNGPADSIAATGIVLVGPGQYTQPAPVIFEVDTSSVTGTVAMPAIGSVRIELFADDGDEGRFFLVGFDAPPSGNFTQAINLGGQLGRQITATATWVHPIAELRYTSQFSSPMPVGNQMALLVGHSGSGEGHIGSSPAGIDCGNGGLSCEVNFVHGIPVQLTATPLSGSLFAGWLGDGCAGNQTTCTVTMNQQRTVFAAFQPIPSVQFKVNVGALGTSGAGGRIVSQPVGLDCSSSSCVVPFAQGTALTLTAIPNPNAYLFTWNGGDCHGGSDPVCTLTVDDNKVERAVFRLLRHRVHVDLVGNGRIQSAPAGITCLAPGEPGCTWDAFEHGINVTLTPTPGAGESFLGWQDGSCQAFGTAPCVLPMFTGYQVNPLFSNNDLIFGNDFEQP